MKIFNPLKRQSSPNLGLSCLLLVAFLSYGFAIWWGVPTEQNWAVDALEPLSILRGEWYQPYPPLHRYVLWVLFFPLQLLDQLGWIEIENSLLMASLLKLLGRALSVLMGVGIISNLYFISKDLSKSELAALLTAACALGIAPLVYYNKNLNVETPYIYWFSLALLFYIRALQKARPGDYLGFGISAAFSVCTKDQAYGLFLLPIVCLMVEGFSNSKQRSPQKSLLGHLFNSQFCLLSLGGIIPFVFIHNILLDPASFLEHLDNLNTAGYQVLEAADRPQYGITEHLELFQRFWLDIQFNMGKPLFYASLLATVGCFLNRQKQRLAIYLAAPALSYYLFFISVVLYSRDRFVIPVCLILCLFIGWFWHDVITSSSKHQKKIVSAGALLVLAYSWLYANSINVLMLQDARYQTERWMKRQMPADSVVGHVGIITYHPRISFITQPEGVFLGPKDLLSEEQLKDLDYVILSSGFSKQRFPSDSLEYQGFQKLENGEAGYKLVFSHQSTPLFNLLDIPQSSAKEFGNPRHKTGNLNKINPKISIYQRQQ